ncbi:reverse transcriptase domain-containing protein [Tanacetum coccineum]
MLKAGKLSHLIKKLKQNSGKEQPKSAKIGETFGKDKVLAILMVQPWERVARLRLKIKNQLVPATTLLIGFSIEIIWPIGQIQLLVRIGDEEHSASAWMNFVVVRLVLPECAMVSGLEGTLPATKPIVEERVKMAINPEYPEQTVMIGSTLNEEGRNKLCDLLQRNLDIFLEACLYDRRPKAHYGSQLKCAGGMLSDAYKGYHQIQMAKEDEEKTVFITSQGIFCYTKMPFNLRNAGATYQRLVDIAFHKQIGRNLEVYVDDLVIKSRTEDEIVRDVEETFKTLREINMKLNLKKCTFAVEEGRRCGRRIQSQHQRAESMSRQGRRCLKSSIPKMLERRTKVKLKAHKSKQKSDFHWTMEAEEAFKQIKQLIAELPMLAAPMEKEELIVYLAKTKETVNAALMTEREAKQMPIYFVSSALRGPEINYTSMEKLVLALVLSRLEVAGRLQKWSIELGEYAIHYRPRVLVKGQILADFIVERLEEDSPDTLMETEEELPEPWILFDGTNNEAEYEALIAELRIAEQIGEVEILAVVEEGDTWMTPIFKYLTEETLPAEVKKARAVRRKSQQFVVINGTLYNKSFLGPWLRHMIRRGKSLKDWSPQQKPTPITSPRPFYKWEIDIARPFPKGPRKLKFLIVAIDYFTKWIESKPIATITGNQIKKFVWENIVYKWPCRESKSQSRRRNKRRQEARIRWKSSLITEAIIPTEITMPTLRTVEVDLGQNNEALEINLDLLEERREQAAIRDAKSKAKMEKHITTSKRSQATVVSSR